MDQSLKEHDYIVVEDVFSKDNYNLLKEYFETCEWNFTNETNDHKFNNLTKEQALQDYGLVNLVQMYDQSKNSVVAKIFADNIKNFFSLDKVQRIKAGLFTPSESEIIHWPHVDMEKPHWTGLYYFSTEKDAGHTYIYNQRWDAYKYKNANEQWSLTKDDFEIEAKIEAKENRAVFFKGDVYHSSSRPRTIFKRIAINVNFEGQPLSV